MLVKIIDWDYRAQRKVFGGTMQECSTTVEYQDGDKREIRFPSTDAPWFRGDLRNTLIELSLYWLDRKNHLLISGNTYAVINY